jgi:hypothetical protein
LGLGLLGCGNDATGPGVLTASQAYWTLRLNYHAVNLALQVPYDTVQLIATPLNANGEVLLSTPPVTFTAGDSTVSVDSTGFVTANYRTRNVQRPTMVIASLQYQNITLRDTVLIQVTPTAPTAALKTFALMPLMGVGTTCNLNALSVSLVENCGPIAVLATDADGDTIADANGSALLINYATLNPRAARIDQSGDITETDTGHVTFTASTWAYGTMKADSLHVAVSWPRYTMNQISEVTPANSLTSVLVFEPSKTVSVGGTVVWYNPYANPIDIVFDDSTTIGEGCLYLLCGILPSTGTGNVPPFYTDATYSDPSPFASGFAGRSFPVAGTYHYHSRLYPSSTGVIYVKEDLSP